jgi:hypothetical protein
MSQKIPRPAGRYVVRGIDINLDGKLIQDGQPIDLTAEQATKFWKHIEPDKANPVEWPKLENGPNEGDVLLAENTILKDQNTALQNEIASLKDQLNQLTQAPINKEPSAPPPAPALDQKESKKTK